jgi:pimeloyl-ACP methyl ester carboxylesterase
VELAGDPNGKPILVYVGEPMSRRLYSGWIVDAERKGIRLISYDRPGYGGSTPNPGHTLASSTDDVRAIAAVLGYDRLGVWGISGGGPYALGCAAMLPDLAVAVCSVAAHAPYGVEGFDYFDGMDESNAEATQQFFADPEAERLDLHQAREDILNATVEQEAALLSPVDAAVYTGELAEWLLESNKLALSQGDQGWWDNDVAILNDWGFDLRDIKVPVKIWHGRQDQATPIQHGLYLAATIPGAEADITDHGHLAQLNRAPEFHAWLLSHF